jgi:hypothetical protein
MDDATRCLFCDRAPVELVDVPSQSARACRACLARLGAMVLDGDLRAMALWPALLHTDDDDDGPEPTLQLADGRRVELRERTAALKADLTPEQRAELTGTYVTIGLFREAVLEAATVLRGDAPPAAATAALEWLLAPPLGRPGVVDAVRGLLRPS